MSGMGTVIVRLIHNPFFSSKVIFDLFISYLVTKKFSLRCLSRKFILPSKTNNCLKYTKNMKINKMVYICLDIFIISNVDIMTVLEIKR